MIDSSKRSLFKLILLFSIACQLRLGSTEPFAKLVAAQLHLSRLESIVYLISAVPQVRLLDVLALARAVK